ncbi:glycosyltransferase family 4 protein [Candidatus Saccharibacteria bacterium]|nr:glycosyltransferase family 4 protein [Candidatus Saccharibacteria bacterium]
MKIAFFSDCFLDLTGGIVSSINAQKAALEKAGHTVYVFSSGYPKSASKLKTLANQNIFQVPSCKLFFFGLTPVSRRPAVIERWLVREHPEIKDFDIYYIHYEAGCSIAGLRLGKKLHIPTAQVMHGREDMGEGNIIPFGFRTIVAVLLNWFHSWYLPHSVKVRRDDYLADSIAKARMWTMMVNHANYADLVLTPSAHFREKLIHYGVKKEIKVFPNGYADQNYPENPPLKTLEPGETLKIVWHSRVSAEKRMMPFLHALLKVKGKYRLDVYGGGGDYFRAQRFAKHHHLNVHFHGNVKFEKLKEAIADSHLDVLASYNFDTFGMTLIEAEAYGVPVFFCDPDMKEVVPAGSYVMSKSPSVEDMADALNELINHPDRIAEMSKVMLSHREEILVSRRIKILEKIFDIMKS